MRMSQEIGQSSNHAIAQSLNRGGLFWRLWWRSISVKRPQAALAVTSLLVGAAITSLLLNLYGGVQRKMTQDFRGYGANAVLAPAPVAPLEPLTPGASVMDEAAVRPLQRFAPGTSGAVFAPILYSVIRLTRTPADPRLPGSINAVAVGTDLAALQRLNAGWHTQAGEERLAGVELKPATCAVGAHLATRLRVKAGDTVKLGSLNGGSIGTQAELATCRIVMILSTGGAEDDQVFLPLAELQSLVGMPGKITLVEMSIPGETAEVERAIHELSSLLPGVEVRPIRQIVYSEGKVLGTIRWLSLSLTALILVIIAICVMATMTAIVLERRKDIGVMKALGASDSVVVRLFLTEGAGLGLVGAILGYCAGSPLAYVIARRLFGVSLSVSWWTLPVVCLLTMLLAVIATLFPVRIIRGIQPAVVLKGE